MISIEEFYEHNEIDEEFDEEFYRSIINHPDLDDFYQPYCSENDIPERYRLYYHYHQYGRYFGAKKRKEDLIPKFEEEVLDIPLANEIKGIKESIPKISIVVPNYNYGNFIKENLESIISQTYPNKEIIVVDGGSTDDSLEIINRYKDKIDIIISEKDNGQSEAIEKGFKLATGDILCWLNSDDSFCKDALWAISLTFQHHKVDMVAATCHVADNDSIFSKCMPLYDKEELCLKDMLDLDNKWMKGDFFYQPEVFFTRSIYEKAGGYIDKTLHWSMDYDLWVRFAAQSAKIKIISHPVSYHVQHEKQKTSELQFVDELYSHRDKLANKYKINVPQSGDETRPKYFNIVTFNDVGFECGAGIAHKNFCHALQMANHFISPVQGTEEISSQRADFDVEKTLSKIDTINPDFVFCGNVHSLQNDLDFLEQVVEKYPTFFLMHDEWLITGKCPYSKHCNQFLKECTSTCPDLFNYPFLDKDQINSHYHRKRKLIQHENFTILCNSYHMVNLVEKTTNQKAYCVKPCIDTDMFRPYEKNACRDTFNLPKDKFIILIGATNLADERKGTNDAMRAINETQIDNCMIVTFGNGIISPEELKYDIVNLGFIKDRKMIAYLYSAADVFVGPSLQEAFGMVFAESSSCGTPCVGYASQGVNESIVNGVTGLTCAKNNIGDLSNNIQLLHDDKDLRNYISHAGPYYIKSNTSYHNAYKQMILALEQSGFLDKHNTRLRNHFINKKECKW
tara:strand:+ start:1063 stop:3276 length:2214 start_codon:yes stop_codon:yes gene_type:complete